MGDVNERILFVDDDPHLLGAIQRELHGRFNVTTALSGDAAMELLRRGESFAVIVADYHMPGMNGVELLEAAHGICPETVKVMLTVASDFEVAIRALNQGQVCKYLTKPWSPAAMEETLKDCLPRYSLNVQRQRWRQAFKSPLGIVRDAWIDRLTSIWNRAAFEDYHPLLHREAAVTGRPYALCLGDIDHFKEYNDHYGHLAGDEALRNVAAAMQGSLRETEFIARYGGEEIVVLFENIAASHLSTVAERLRAAVWDLQIPHDYNEHYGRLTISIGAAFFTTACNGSPRDVLARADAALYRAKGPGGRNAVAVDAATFRAPEQDILLHSPSH